MRNRVLHCHLHLLPSSHTITTSIFTFIIIFPHYYAALPSRSFHKPSITTPFSSISHKYDYTDPTRTDRLHHLSTPPLPHLATSQPPPSPYISTSLITTKNQTPSHPLLATSPLSLSPLRFETLQFALHITPLLLCLHHYLSS